MQYAPTLPGKNSSGFWFVFIRRIKNRIGINFIRPLAWPFVGRMLLRPYTGDLKNGDFSIHSTTGVAVCRAYSIRPYTGYLKNGDFSVRPTTSVAVFWAYAIRPYTDDLKNGDFSICSASGVAVYGAYAIRPYTGGQKLGWVLVRF